MYQLYDIVLVMNLLSKAQTSKFLRNSLSELQLIIKFI